MTFGAGVYGVQIYGASPTPVGRAVTYSAPIVVERTLRPMGSFGPVDLLQRTINVNQTLVCKLTFVDKHNKKIIPPDFTVNEVTSKYTLQSDTIVENNVNKLRLLVTLHTSKYVFLRFIEIDDYSIFLRLFAREPN